MGPEFVDDLLCCVTSSDHLFPLFLFKSNIASGSVLGGQVRIECVRYDHRGKDEKRHRHSACGPSGGCASSSNEQAGSQSSRRGLTKTRNP